MVSTCPTTRRAVCCKDYASRHTVIGVLTLLLLGATGMASGASFVGLVVGFAGYYKVGVWTPVKLTLRGGDAPQIGVVRVTVLDDEGVPSQFTAPGGPCKVEAGRETNVWLCVRFGRPSGALSAEFLAGGQIVARHVFEPVERSEAGQQFLPALETNQPLLLLIGPRSMGVAEAVGDRYAPEGTPIVVDMPAVDELPAVWYGYEGVDKVIVAAGGAATDGKVPSDAPQIEALDAWVRQGGRMLLCAGSQAERIARPDSPWSRFLPGRLKAMVGLRQTGQLEAFAGSTIPVPLGIAGPDELRVPQLADVRGVVELSEADLPLVVRSARGFGETAFLAADLDQPPLCSWKGRRLLIRRLLDQPAAEQEESGRSRPMMHQGFLDTAGQLRKSLNRFDGIQATPFWLVVAMLAAYVLLIGPVDYYVVRRIVGRMVLTWLTFPLMITAVGSAAYFLTQGLKGNQVRLHQVDVVDVDAAAGLVRGTGWVELFSPRAEAYNLAAKPISFGPAVRGRRALPPRPLRLLRVCSFPGSACREPGWAGWLPGLSILLSGPSRTASRQGWTGSSRCRCRRGLRARSRRRWDACTVSPVRAELMSEDRLLSGVVRSDLAFPLTQCRLAYGPWSHDLGTLESGKPLRLGAATRRCELRSFPTGRRTPYNRDSLDSAYILQTMSFHAAVGAQSTPGCWAATSGSSTSAACSAPARRCWWASLRPRPPARCPEWSYCAMAGRSAAPGDEHLRVYRFVFPVKEHGNRQLAAPNPQDPLPPS